jgi:hypothetical protein
MMTFESFRESLTSEAPPVSAEIAVQALWWAGKGDWNRAHACAQQREGDLACDLVHAHLHRQEGDLANAGYWYRRVGQPVSQLPLQDEWEAIARQLLTSSQRLE